MSMLWSWKWKCSWLARSPSQPLTSADLVNSEISTRKLQWLLNIRDTITIPHKENLNTWTSNWKQLFQHYDLAVHAIRENCSFGEPSPPSCTIHFVRKRFVMYTLHYELCKRSNSLQIMDYAQCRTLYAVSKLPSALCTMQHTVLFRVHLALWDGSGCQNGLNFGKLPKGRAGGSFMIQKFMLHIFEL